MPTGIRGRARRNRLERTTLRGISLIKEEVMIKIGSTEWWSNLVTYLLLSATFGIFGTDRFYKGEVLWGILKLISGGGCLIWYIVDVCIHAYRFGKTGQWTKASVTSNIV
jgi:hypothetical protein